MQIKCPRCNEAIEVDPQTTLSDIRCPACQNSFALEVEETLGSQRRPADIRCPTGLCPRSALLLRRRSRPLAGFVC
jgi:transposase-like protein